MKFIELFEGATPKLPGAPSGVSVMSPEQFLAKSAKGEEPGPEEDVDEDLSRRGFLKGLGVASLAGTGLFTNVYAQTTDGAPLKITQEWFNKWFKEFFANVDRNMAPKEKTTAKVQIFFDSDGKILKRRILKSSGNENWDQVIINAIDKTKYVPTFGKGISGDLSFDINSAADTNKSDTTIHQPNKPEKHRRPRKRNFRIKSS